MNTVVASTVGQRPYTFGFLLATTLGNMTHYLNLKKYVDRDPEVTAIYAPANHYTPPDFPSKLRFLPAPLFMRARILEQALPVLGNLNAMDAVMVHLFEGEIICSIRSYFARRPILFSSTDEAPIVDRSTYPLYPQHLNKAPWRQRLRLSSDMWRISRFDYFIPFSDWVENILVGQCAAPRERVKSIHVGVDLEVWKSEPRQRRHTGTVPKILFVGGDFERKGGKLLLDVFCKRFQNGAAELHLVTKQAPATLPPGVHAYRDFEPNDPRMIELYSRCDMVVVPTRADYGPLWVFLEAMAMRLPIVGTDTGSLREQIIDGETGFIVSIDDADSLGDAIERLLADEPLRLRMGERGRALVETRYQAAVNVPLIVNAMKIAVDKSRAKH